MECGAVPARAMPRQPQVLCLIHDARPAPMRQAVEKHRPIGDRIQLSENRLLLVGVEPTIAVLPPDVADISTVPLPRNRQLEKMGRRLAERDRPGAEANEALLPLKGEVVPAHRRSE